jgi:hypothetical protein
VQQEVDELRDLDVVDGDRGLIVVMTKFCCLAFSSLRRHADMP